MLNVIEKTSKSVNFIWNIDWLSYSIWVPTKYSTTHTHLSYHLHVFQFLQLPKSLFCLCDLTISMDADCLLPWKSVLPWSRPEISHAPTLSMYGREGLVVGKRSSTMWFKMPYAIHRLSEFDHTSLYFTDIQKILDNVWPFWEDFAISLEIIFIPAAAPEYSWNSQASRFLATLLQDQSLFLESEDGPYWESEGWWDYWQNHWKMWEKRINICSIWSTQIPVPILPSSSWTSIKDPRIRHKIHKVISSGHILSWTNIKLPKTNKSPLKMDS